MQVRYNTIANIQGSNAINSAKNPNITAPLSHQQKSADGILSAMNISGSQSFSGLNAKTYPDKVQVVKNGNVTTTTLVSTKDNFFSGKRVPERIKVSTQTVKPDGTVKTNDIVTRAVSQIEGIKDVDSKALNHITNFGLNGGKINGCHNAEFYEGLLNIPTNDTLREHFKKFGYDKKGEYTIKQHGNGVTFKIPNGSGLDKVIDLEKTSKNSYETLVDGVKLQKTCCSNADELKEFYEKAMNSFADKTVPKIIRSKDVADPAQVYFEMPIALKSGAKKVAAGYLDLAKKFPITIFPIDKPTVNRLFHSLF